MSYPPQQPDPYSQQWPAQQPYQPYPQQPGYPPVQPAYYQQPQLAPPAYQSSTTTSSTGLPGWMHALYAVGTLFTCGLLGIAWAIHWWMAQSKSKSTTVHSNPMPPQQPPPPPRY